MAARELNLDLNSEVYLLSFHNVSLQKVLVITLQVVGSSSALFRFECAVEMPFSPVSFWVMNENMGADKTSLHHRNMKEAKFHEIDWQQPNKQEILHRSIGLH